MRKFFMSLFVLTSMALTTACSSDDDSSGEGDDLTNKLTANIDGTNVTFDVIEVNQVTGTDMEVVASVNGDATREFLFAMGVGSVGDDAVFYSEYMKNNIEYYNNGGSVDPFFSNVAINDGAKVEMTFSGILTGYDFNLEQDVSINIQNGSLSVEY